MLWFAPSLLQRLGGVYLSLVLGVALDWPELRVPVGKLALAAIAARPSLLPGAAQLRLHSGNDSADVATPPPPRLYMGRPPPSARSGTAPSAQQE